MGRVQKVVAILITGALPSTPLEAWKLSSIFFHCSQTFSELHSNSSEIGLEVQVSNNNARPDIVFRSRTLHDNTFSRK